MYVNGKNILVKNNAGTKDIIQALINVVPVAVDQCKGYIDSMIYKSGDPLIDAERCCRYIRANVKYKADGFAEQNIQLPGRMFKDTKQADCKSFSLAFVGMMKALGHECGFRFASYRKNKIPTHVYNFVVCNGKKFTFDACVENLKESPRHTYIQDMKVQYLTGIPNMEQDLISGRAERQQRRQERRENRQERREDRQERRQERKSEGRGVLNTAKKVTLAPVRNAFLALVRLNVRGLAKKLNIALQKDQSTTKAFWEKLGGKFDSLSSAINAGKNKRPLAGESKRGRTGRGMGFYYADTEEAYIGEDDQNEDGIGEVTLAAVGTFLAVATPALIAASNLFKKNNIQDDAESGLTVTQEEAASSEKLPAGFEAADPEGGSGLNLGFKPSPLMIGGIVGGLALVYFLTKKKK
jgi:hypothetical protein